MQLEFPYLFAGSSVGNNDFPKICNCNNLIINMLPRQKHFSFEGANFVTCVNVPESGGCPA